MTSEVEEYVLVQDCLFEPAHVHEYEADWQFGGPLGTDPRSDPRFLSAVYVYLDGTLHPVHTTSAYICDDEAIDQFTQIADWGLAPVYLQVTRPGEKPVMIPWTYDEATDTVTPFN